MNESGRDEESISVDQKKTINSTKAAMLRKIECQPRRKREPTRQSLRLNTDRKKCVVVLFPPAKRVLAVDKTPCPEKLNIDGPGLIKRQTVPDIIIKKM